MVATVAVLMVIVPAVFLGWIRLRTEDRLAVLDVAPVPIVIDLTERLDDMHRLVEIRGTWSAGVGIAAPNWSGLVTELPIVGGSRLVEGDSVVVIDGFARVAVATPTPFFRVLDSSSSGQDVVNLQELLTRFGHFSGEPSGRYGSATASAVAAWSTQLGSSRPVRQFDPAWVVWLPEEPFEVEEVLTATGFPAPAAGEAWLFGRPYLEAVRIIGPDGVDMALPGSWLLSVGTQELIVADGQLSLDAIEQLADLLPPAEDDSGVSSLTGEIKLREPRVATELPAAAVVVTSDGQPCVYRVEGEAFHPIEVTLGSGRGGRVEVVAGLETGDQILGNPADILGALDCGSS